jgi:hypothetical protein
MREIDISVPEGAGSDAIEAAVEHTCKSLGLTLAMRSSLSKYPGCVHWHMKRKGEKGTLEITAWPDRRPLWIKIHAGRAARWIDEIIPGFASDVQRRLEE